MGDNQNRKVYQSRPVKNYRELVEYSCTNYAKNIAYKYKKDYTAKDVEYIEKSYEQTGKDIKYLSFTIPILIIIFMKYSLNIEKNNEGDPTTILYQDKILLLLCFIYGVIMLTFMVVLK